MDYGKTTLRNAGLRHLPIKVSGVYKITNTLDGKFYIGSAKSIRRRLRYHLMLLRKGVHNSPHLQRAYSRDGEAAFTFQIVEEVAPELLYEREQFWIDSTQCYIDSIGYNICRIAGPPKIVFNAEMRASMSAQRKGKRKTADHRRNIGEAHRGRRLSESHKAKIRNTVMAYWAIEENIVSYSLRKKGRPSPHRGKTVSQSAKRKQSETQKLKYLDPGRREQLRKAGLRGALASKSGEVRRKISEKLKGRPNLKIRKYNDDDVSRWRDMRAAGLFYKSISQIVNVDVATVFKRLTAIYQ